MTSWKKIIIGTGITAGIVGAVAYASRLIRTGKQLESVAKAMVHSFDEKGLTIRIDVQLKNPTGSKLKIKFPFVKVVQVKTEKENGKEKIKIDVIDTSKVIDKDITIPTHGEANVNGIMINVPISQIISLGSGLLSVLTKKKSVPITVKTITTVDLGWKKIPYEKSDNMTIKPKA